MGTGDGRGRGREARGGRGSRQERVLRPGTEWNTRGVGDGHPGNNADRVRPGHRLERDHERGRPYDEEAYGTERPGPADFRQSLSSGRYPIEDDGRGAGMEPWRSYGAGTRFDTPPHGDPATGVVAPEPHGHQDQSDQSPGAEPAEEEVPGETPPPPGSTPSNYALDPSLQPPHGEDPGVAAVDSLEEDPGALPQGHSASTPSDATVELSGPGMEAASEAASEAKVPGQEYHRAGHSPHPGEKAEASTAGEGTGDSPPLAAAPVDGGEHPGGGRARSGEDQGRPGGYSEEAWETPGVGGWTVEDPAREQPQKQQPQSSQREPTETVWDWEYPWGQAGSWVAPGESRRRRR